MQTSCVSAETDKAAELKDLRATAEEQTRAIRLRNACEAMERLGGGLALAYARSWRASGVALDLSIVAARAYLQTVRLSLADGRDDRRYAAACTALDALGALWCCS